MTDGLPERATAALDAIQVAERELERMHTEYVRTGNVSLLRERLDRWHERTAAQFRRHLLPRDASRFADLDIDTTYHGYGGGDYDPVGEVMRTLVVFTTALTEDIKQHPSDYAAALSPATAKATTDHLVTRRLPQAVPPPTVPERTALATPEKVTLAWLWHNVPVKVWFGLVASMVAVAVAAFSLGFRLAQSPQGLTVTKTVFPDLGGSSGGPPDPRPTPPVGQPRGTTVRP